ncbi:MAG TPA: TIGR04438 family Trp-rich protein [Aquabacterium sp.]|uniref:TIGR04438 family Trp-rich protein n=1 Tax=Aquabacterium sp. TaxID=1872578 RepID=UPI002E34028C|nr:TIGR04438 family Trp-rich protein [Aquabacterium sp.]HEX5357210.1 TIGR04438 family Trp-rich protein [Aquabacterium sp.]
MWFVAIGVLVLILNIAGIGPVGAWTWKEHWWIMLSPFALAALWWAWADWSGLTQRKAMKKVDDKREARRQKSLDALGLQSPRKGKR